MESILALVSWGSMLGGSRDAHPFSQHMQAHTHSEPLLMCMLAAGRDGQPSPGLTSCFTP